MSVEACCNELSMFPRYRSDERYRIRCLCPLSVASLTDRFFSQTHHPDDPSPGVFETHGLTVLDALGIPSTLGKEFTIGLVGVDRDVFVGGRVVDGVDYGFSEACGHAFPTARRAEDHRVVWP